MKLGMHRSRTGLTVFLALALALSGCASTEDERSMSPSERRLKENTSRFYETVGTGAVVGALLGAAIGAAAGGKNRGSAAAMGAGLGAVAGAGAGYYVAKRNENAGNSEAALNERIQAAQKEVQNYRDIAGSAQTVAAENRAKLAALDARYRKGEIDAAEYRRQAQNARVAQDRIKKAIENAQTVSAGLSQDVAASSGSKRQAFQRSEDEMSRLEQSLAQSQASLAQALAGVPG
jgi:uncharacterized membrane protein